MTVDPGVVVAVISALAAGLSAAIARVYFDMKADRDYWRDAALRSLRHTDKALDVAQATAKVDGV